MKHNDIFKWRYNDEILKLKKDGYNGGTTYWCVSCIGIYNAKKRKLIDTYWNTNNNISFSDNQIKDMLIIKYIGNLDKLKPCNKEDFKYYKNSDCIDISHANMPRDGFYLKKNAKKSLYKMKKYLKNKIKNRKNNIEFEKKMLQYDIDKLKNLKISDFI